MYLGNVLEVLQLSGGSSCGAKRQTGYSWPGYKCFFVFGGVCLFACACRAILLWVLLLLVYVRNVELFVLMNVCWGVI